MRAVTAIFAFAITSMALVQPGMCQQLKATPRPLENGSSRALQDVPNNDQDPNAPLPSSTLNSSGDLSLTHCVVSLIEDIEVPAREPGQLISVGVREGDQVSKGGVIAKIDDRLAQRQIEESTFKQLVAETKFSDMTKVEASKKILSYTKAELARTEGLFFKGSESEKAFLEAKTNVELKQLDVSSADTDRKIAEIEFKSEGVRLEAARDSMERHGLVAPIDGQVFEIFRQQGEWVMAGDKVFRVARMDKLRVTGRVNSLGHNPADVANRRVTVVAKLAGGRTVSLNGQITFVAMESDGSFDHFAVWADVENQQENGFWLLLSGVNVEMTIHLNEAALPINNTQVSGPISNRPTVDSPKR